MIRSVILGCRGPVPSEAERRFFAQSDPLGFILFSRNCESPEQVRALVAELRASVGRQDAPVLIDQEGGRVVRLRLAHWRAAAPAAVFGDIALRDREKARRAVWLNARLLAAGLSELGITVNCAPVLDLRLPGAHDVIGDRAFGSEPGLVADLGRAYSDGLLAGGAFPVIKHLPGHGRARVDSHVTLPIVDAARQDLAATDFAPFRSLADAPWGMTAHVVYTALDPERPATTSPVVISEVIRGAIGFDGVLVSDDLSMQALSGDMRARAAAALAAGCDVVLHCSGDMEEMASVVEGVASMADLTRTRLERAEARRKAAFDPDFDPVQARRELDALLGDA